jgi:hypothetical protein
LTKLTIRHITSHTIIGRIEGKPTVASQARARIGTQLTIRRTILIGLAQSSRGNAPGHKTKAAKCAVQSAVQTVVNRAVCVICGRVVLLAGVP